MRKVGVVTVARSDYSIYLPVLKRLRQDPDVTLVLIAGGMHLSLEFGLTADLIEADGFSIDHRVEMLQPSDAPEGIAHSMGLGTMGFAQAYADSSPDLLLLLGDRFEMHSAAVAALPFNIPIAHIHGGEVTEGAMDDALRHSITKMSHLHFVSNDDARRRVMQLGEEAWRITVSGAPGIDNLRGAELMDKTEMGALLDFDLKSQPLLVTYHPVTLENDDVRPQVENLLAALIDSGRQMIFTMSNADTNGRFIMGMINEFTKTCADAHVVKNLGTQGYYSLMSLAGAMVGNSSSGIIEAPSFGLPVVNIGSRQGKT